jgi:hypothetical protein
MSQYAGDMGSRMMSAYSQFQQNAKKKNVVIPKGTVFKNAKIRMAWDNKTGTYYLSTGVKDVKRGTYDDGGRSLKESDFIVKNLIKEGDNFFNVKNFLVVKNNGFDISENAIADIELNKDITISIFDEPFVDPFISNQNYGNSIPRNEIFTNMQEAFIKNTQQQQPFLEKHKNHLLLLLAVVAGYFAYKKFKK